MSVNKHIEFAGDFRLNSIVIQNHEAKGGRYGKEGVDIKKIVVEFNIYESMFANALTGSLVIADSTNLIGNLPIQGTERLTFKLSTPGGPVIDCSEESGHPMHIYALTDKAQDKDGLQIYTLHFASREFLRNIRTRVSQAYDMRIDQMVASIFGDENYLDSRKTLKVEKTQNKDKIVIPNMHPFLAISMLSGRAMSDSTGTKDGHGHSVGYHFYETTKGFHFRSWDSMCTDEQGNPRDLKQTFEYMPVNITDKDAYDESEGRDKITHEYQGVEEYRFLNSSHDTVANQAQGTYGNRVITHNIYDKSYRHDDYHYHNRYSDTKHTDGNKPPVVSTPVDFDDKGLSDYPESRLSVIPTTRFAHGKDTGNFGIDVEQDGITESAKISQRNQISMGARLQMTVKGQSYLEVGDVIQFNVQSVENKVESAGSWDPQYSGRYIITKIRHRVTDTEYLNVLECAKDSVANAFSSYQTTFPGKKPLKDKGNIQDIYS